MRLVELCLRESAAAFGWGFSGTYLVSKKGYLAFLLYVTPGEDGLDFSLSYRYADFDRIYHTLTFATRYPGIVLFERTEPVESWSLLGVSSAMRRLTEKADKFAASLSERIITLEDNTAFLRYLASRQRADGQPPCDITPELIFTALLNNDLDQAVSLSTKALINGDLNDGLYSKVLDYAKRFQKI